MSPALRLPYRWLPSFRAEAPGGLHGLWVRAASRAYSWRAGRRYRRGLHGPVTVRGRCQWCGGAS